MNLEDAATPLLYIPAIVLRFSNNDREPRLSWNLFLSSARKTAGKQESKVTNPRRHSSSHVASNPHQDKTCLLTFGQYPSCILGRVSGLKNFIRVIITGTSRIRRSCKIIALFLIMGKI